MPPPQLARCTNANTIQPKKSSLCKQKSPTGLQGGRSRLAFRNLSCYLSGTIKGEKEKHVALAVIFSWEISAKSVACRACIHRDGARKGGRHTDSSAYLLQGTGNSQESGSLAQKGSNSYLHLRNQRICVYIQRSSLLML